MSTLSRERSGSGSKLAMRRRPRSGSEGTHEASQERWLLTYADMITLLLVLFIVLFAISNIDQAKYREFKQSISKAVLSKVPHGTTQVASPAKAQGPDQLLQIEAKLKAALKAKDLLKNVTISIDSSGLVEGLVSDSTFFGTNSADLSAIGAMIVDTSSVALKGYTNAIEVAGYTDNEPVLGGKYSSNWSLSAARATTVVLRMTKTDGINPTRVALIGYGQYHPVASNATPSGQAQNRRVNIIVSPTGKFKP